MSKISLQLTPKVGGRGKKNQASPLEKWKLPIGEGAVLAAGDWVDWILNNSQCSGLSPPHTHHSEESYTKTPPAFPLANRLTEKHLWAVNNNIVSM